MNIWVVVLIIVVVAMVLGPVMMLQPNSLQKSQENLRRHALALGLRVRIMSLPKQASQMEAPDAVPTYCLPHIGSPESTEEWLLYRTTYGHEAHFMEHWQWHGAGRPDENEVGVLRDILPVLPSSVTAVGAGRHGACFYWSERGGVATLDELLLLLKKLNAVRR